MAGRWINCNLIMGGLLMQDLILRKIDYNNDLHVLFKYMTDLESQSLISEQFQINTIQMFDRWLSSRFEMGVYHDFFMIETVGGKTIGFTFSYDFSLANGHCKYTLCLFNEYQGTGLGASAAIQMMNYLFKAYSLKQIYISVYEYNKESLRMNVRGGFEEVGVFPGYRFYAGEYHNLHILRITRKIFNSKYNKNGV